MFCSGRENVCFLSFSHFKVSSQWQRDVSKKNEKNQISDYSWFFETGQEIHLLDIYAVCISDSKWIAPSPAQLIIKRLSYYFITKEVLIYFNNFFGQIALRVLWQTSNQLMFKECSHKTALVNVSCLYMAS